MLLYLHQVVIASNRRTMLIIWFNRDCPNFLEENFCKLVGYPTEFKGKKKYNVNNVCGNNDLERTSAHRGCSKF